MFLSNGQMSDYKGARHLLDALPEANILLADRGYDADWFRDALREKGIEPCIPPKKNRKAKIEYNETLDLLRSSSAYLRGAVLYGVIFSSGL